MLLQVVHDRSHGDTDTQVGGQEEQVGANLLGHQVPVTQMALRVLMLGVAGHQRQSARQHAVDARQFDIDVVVHGRRIG